MTPAQAYGHPNFVTDQPIAGPTDEGLRAADCWWTQNVLPAHPACVDCGESKPMQTLLSGVGERVSLGGKNVRGFLAAAGDPEIWSTLSPAQQAWVMSFLSTLNGMITKTTATMCHGWVAPSGASGITNAVGCFQSWFNAQYPPGSPVKQLRTDGAFDQDTLYGVQTIAGLHPTDFPTPYPMSSSKKLSTGAMVGIAAGGAAVVGGLAYAVYGGKKKSRRSRR